MIGVVCPSLSCIERLKGDGRESDWLIVPFLAPEAVSCVTICCHLEDATVLSLCGCRFGGRLSRHGPEALKQGNTAWRVVH